MLEQEFEKQIKKPDKIQDALNYILCSSMIVGGLFFFYKFFQSVKQNSETYQFIYPALFLSILGGYGLWRISKDYKIVKVISNQSLEQKTKVIEEFITTINIKSLSVEDDIYIIQYRNKFWVSVDVFIGFDNDFYYLNAKASDYGSKGIIDFGITRRSLKKLENYFTGKANL
ncbi:hypothetical protein [Pedobacter cryotolerans]|uniref:Uncharacterized protein n=1 Tax=Pedobacter cryotolerans TaxID=2571270 RepID=A0A4U1C7C4_9SPHI|nr:hypothetical protein [Pedobacter cryotolerans]TKC01344.1 hypothetical protein FA045_08890 [Pedobacter cryotolerans]